MKLIFIIYVKNNIVGTPSQMFALVICRENMKQEFAAAICRGNLPQLFAVAICRENLKDKSNYRFPSIVKNNNKGLKLPKVRREK